MSQKVGFWSVFAIVIGSQIGSGVFMLSATLAPFGIFGLFGWIASALGAIALCLVFASLCAHFPKTGGPHVYVQQAFGPTAAFFTGWTYWIISWVSTTTVIVTSVGYLSPFIGIQNPNIYLILQIGLLSLITFINLKGVKVAGNAEFFLGTLKFIPLLILPAIALFYFNPQHFSIDSNLTELPPLHLLGQVTVLTLWGFIGLESATAPAGAVENPSKTIPKAIILGTICVAVLYIVNYLGISGLMPKETLLHSRAPYADATQYLLGGSWHLLVSLIATIVCIGTLNAWVLISGQIMLGLAQDSLMPAIFSKKNKAEAPYVALCCSSLGVVPLLFLTASESLAQQITLIIDFSVVAFLFIYFICTASFLKFLVVHKFWHWLVHCAYASMALLFCTWIIYTSPIQTILVSSLFTLSGIPIYVLWYRRQNGNLKTSSIELVRNGI